MRRKTLLVPAIAAALIGGAWWRTRPPTDPIYNGKPLSEWLRRPWEEGLSEDDLHAIGKPGVKWLTYAVEHEYSRRPFRHSIYIHAPVWLQARLPIEWTSYEEYDSRPAAAEALEVLGVAAAPAIPALARMIHNDDFNYSEAFARALQVTGPDSWPVIEEYLAHGTLAERRVLISTMPFRLQNNEREAVVSVLLRALHDTHSELRGSAIKALGECQGRIDSAQMRQIVIQELISLFGDAVFDVAMATVNALATFQPEATQSIPHFIQLLDNPNPSIRGMAAALLGKLGSPANESIPRLKAMTADSEPTCRALARDALAALGEIQNP